MFLKLKQRQLYLNFVSPSYSNSYKTYISKAAVSVKIDYKNSIYIVHKFSISSTTKGFCNNSNDDLIDFVFLDRNSKSALDSYIFFIIILCERLRSYD